MTGRKDHPEIEYRPLDMDVFCTVDFKRLAFPQEDGYDSDVFEEIAAWRYCWSSTYPEDGAPAWLHDIEIRSVAPYHSWDDKKWFDIPTDDPRWDMAAEMIAEWPEQQAQFQRLINFLGRAGPVGQGSTGNGCSCGGVGGNPFHKNVHIGPDRWGCMYVASGCCSGFLEGVCHELAHWKGYALGVYIEEWENLIFANPVPDPDDIRDAPGRYDLSDEERRRIWNPRGIGLQPFNERCRPIGAMFQEIWCMVHMVDLHLHLWPMVQDGRTEERAPVFKEWARFHVERTLRGHQDLVNMAQLVPGSGEQFWEGYCSWTDARLEAAARVFCA